MTKAVDSSKDESVRVIVRCRPLNKREIEDGRTRIVEMDLKSGQISVKNPKAPQEPPKTFTFDQIYDWNTVQINLYNETARPIVESCIEGYNGTIFAYGQTGTGKTHTMEGVIDVPELRGITPNSFNHIFDRISITEGQQFLVRASYLEIYNEEIRDLLSKNPKDRLELKENQEGAVYVKDLTSFVVKSVAEINKVLDVGKKNRSVGATAMNQDSSRSHSVFSVTIESTAIGIDGGEHIRVGKLNLVDLAGSERQTKTGATGDRLKEGIKINLSLTALGNVISSLVEGKGGHVPYRDSKLTRLLQDSLGGNTKTVMVANIGPADWNFDETLSTLRYANRAKNIKNKPRINEDPKDAMLREYQSELERLKKQLEEMEGGGVALGAGEPEVQEVVETVEKEVTEEEKARMKAELERKLAEELRSQGVALDEAEVKRLQEEAERKALEEVQRIEEEKQRVEREKAEAKRIIEEKRKEMAAKQGDLEAQRQAKMEVQKRIQQMQGKLLHGSSASMLVEETRKKEEELNRIATELEARRERERQEQEKLRRLEEEVQGRDEKFSNAHEELASRSAKVDELFAKCQALQAEINDSEAEFQREMAELWEQKRIMISELNLKQAMIDLFIPEEEVQKVMRRAQWDPDTEQWTLGPAMRTEEAASSKGGPQRPMSASGSRRPTSAFAKSQILQGDLNPRFKSDNILKLILDMPERTTFDFNEETLADPRVVQMVTSTFVDGEISFAASGAVRGGAGGAPKGSLPGRDASSGTLKRPKSARKSEM